MARRSPLRLPTRQDILQMPLKELERVLRTFGVRVDREGIKLAAYEVYDRITKAIESGALDVDNVTWEYIDNRLENAFRNEVRKQIKAIIRGYRLEAIRNVDAPLRWVAMLIKTCKSCLRRHGQEQLFDDWVAEGLPGSPALICDGNCMCVLVPVSYAGYEDVFDALEKLVE